MATQLRLIRSAPAEPAKNLAIDAALLEIVGPPTLRLYTWRPAGLSLGRFQDGAGFAGVPGDHVVVRRQTGGGAIYHDDELTFALTLEAGSGWTVEEAYLAVHRAIVRALTGVGVRAEVLTSSTTTPTGPRALRHAWCFEHPARLDIVAPDGRKLCGSAQRRVRRPSPRVLHHGSLVLRRPAATPFCAAVSDQADVDAVRDPLAEGIATEIAQTLGLSAIRGAPTDEELAAAQRMTPHFREVGAELRS